MPLNDRKIISIILEQCKQVEQRCTGYREELINTIADIIEFERGHRVEATNIQRKISEKCNATARMLAEARGHGAAPEDE